MRKFLIVYIAVGMVMAGLSGAIYAKKCNDGEVHIAEMAGIVALWPALVIGAIYLGPDAAHRLPDCPGSRP